MGEYIDVGLQSPLIPLTLVISSLVLGFLPFLEWKQKMMMMILIQAVVD